MKRSSRNFSRPQKIVNSRQYLLLQKTVVGCPLALTPRQNVYACVSLSIFGLFFSRTFQSDQSLPRALGFILCAACGSVVLLHAARVFDYFVVIEIAFMDNQAQNTETKVD